jgi:hypothetical protein
MLNYVVLITFDAATLKALLGTTVVEGFLVNHDGPGLLVGAFAEVTFVWLTVCCV